MRDHKGVEIEYGDTVLVLTGEYAGLRGDVSGVRREDDTVGIEEAMGWTYHVSRDEQFLIVEKMT